MSTKTTGSKASYTRHSAEYKRESLKLAAQIGVAKSAKQLGLHESQLYAWRKQSEHTQSVSEREVNLATENARLKRQPAQQTEELSILKNAATYEFMKLRRVHYSLAGMCHCFNVSRSGYTHGCGASPANGFSGVRRWMSRSSPCSIDTSNVMAQKDCNGKCPKKMVSRTI